MNSVELVGTLASDVELSELGEGRRVANFLVAVARPGPGGKVDLIRIAAWNAQAELCARLLAKGDRIGVDGRLRSRVWRDPGGAGRHCVDVVATSVRFLPHPVADAREEVPFEERVAA